MIEEFEKLHGIKWDDTVFSIRACWTDAWITATRLERDACAKLCEDMTARPNPYVTPDNARHFAAAIRARSNQS